MYNGERFNSISHLIGTLLAIAAAVLLIIRAALHGNAYDIVSACIYGACLILLYGVSTIYHSVHSPKLKQILQKTDHCSIYLLIAGSYTPYALVTLRGGWGWSLFGVSWGFALIGIIQEFIFGKGQRILSLLIYLLMGWLILVAIIPTIRLLPLPGLLWLGAGGLFYTVGIYWFVHDEQIKHGHGIWHLFVLLGSIAQYISIYGWVIGYNK